MESERAQGPRHGGHAPGAASGRQALAALGAAAGEDLAAVGGLHAGTEAVVALALEVAGLVGALGGHGGTRADTRRKEPESLLRADLAGQAGSGGGPGGPTLARHASRRLARRCVHRGVVVVCLSPWFPRPLRARIRTRDAAP